MDAPLPPLRSVIDTYDLMAKKSLGQNFLLDLNLTAKIARAAGDLEGKNVIEVGPGPGGLTRALLDTPARAVHAVERDDRCIAALQSLVAHAKGRLTLIPGDALAVDYDALCPRPRALVANLPYNIATVLLIGWLEKTARDSGFFDSMTLMFQKEVADRITAPHATPDYGRLSIVAQWLCHAETRFDIPRTAFTPPPKVTSTVVRLTPRKDRADSVSFSTMERLTAAAFGQRRKMLRQSLKSLDLKSLNVSCEDLLEKAGIAPTLRAEQVDIAGFIRMAQALEGFRAPTNSASP